MTVALDDPAARPLLDELDADLERRYGSGDEVHVSSAQFAPPQGRFVLALADGAAVACGGLRPHSAAIAELKRMYVTPPVRGAGVGRRLLRHLEVTAHEAGYAQLWLETGLMQPEAMRLYESAGYAPIPGFGQFADSPLSRCYGKLLSGRSSSRAPLS